MNLDIPTLPQRDRYKLMIGAVVPRPIAWVSTMDAEGKLNLAPFSFFNAVCSDPMTLMFSVSNTDHPEGKDTVRNIMATGELVINFTDEATAAAMNLTATPLPHGQSEFEWAGLTATPSKSVRVPRVTEAPIAFECRLQQLIKIGHGPGGASVVFAEVKGVYVRDDLYEAGRILIEPYQPIGRIGGDGYTRVNDLFEMARVPAPPPA